MTLGSDETSTSALHRSPKAQRENLVQWADYRGRNNSRGERELFGFLDSLLRPILKTRGPAKLLRLPLCEAALSPPHLSLCLGNFLFWEICLSSTPTSYRVRGCIEKEISQKRKSDSQRLDPSQSCLEEKGNSQPLSQTRPEGSRNSRSLSA